jgi:hypothetical protein
MKMERENRIGVGDFISVAVAGVRYFGIIAKETEEGQFVLLYECDINHQHATIRVSGDDPTIRRYIPIYYCYPLDHPGFTTKALGLVSGVGSPYIDLVENNNLVVGSMTGNSDLLKIGKIGDGEYYDGAEGILRLLNEETKTIPACPLISDMGLPSCERCRNHVGMGMSTGVSCTSRYVRCNFPVEEEK